MPTTNRDGKTKVQMSSNEMLYESRVLADDHPRFVRYTDGKMEWGSGSAVPDTNLYRSDADTLKTDDALVVAGTLAVTGAATLSAALNVPTESGTSTADLTAHGHSQVTTAGVKTFTLAAPAAAGALKDIAAVGGSSTANSVIDAGSGITINGEASHRYIYMLGTGGFAGVSLRATSATNWDIVSIAGSVTYSTSG